jgi:hypothetical protein
MYLRSLASYCKSWDCLKLLILGPTWLRRVYGVGAVHAEHQFAR